MSFWKKNREKISGIGLVVLFGIGTWSIWSGYDERAHLEKVGVRVIGHIYGRYKPYKGSYELRYYFYYNGRKYIDSDPTDKRFPTRVGERRVVVLDSLDPNSNHLLLQEVIDSIHTLDIYIGKPIVINP